MDYYVVELVPSQGLSSAHLALRSLVVPDVGSEAGYRSTQTDCPTALIRHDFVPLPCTLTTQNQENQALAIAERANYLYVWLCQAAALGPSLFQGGDQQGRLCETF